MALNPFAKTDEAQQAIEMSNQPAHRPNSQSTLNHGDGSYSEPRSLEKADTKLATPPETTDAHDLYAHLTEHEAEILRSQVDVPTLSKGVNVLWRYSSKTDVVIIITSLICAAAAGATLPLMTVIFGNLQKTFRDYFFAVGQMTYHDFVQELNKHVLYFVYLAIGMYIVTYIATVGTMYTGEHIAGKIRANYLKACMRQNIGYFDKIGAGEITTRITADTNLIQDGISEKLSLTVTGVAVFISAFVISFANYWKLTLILFATVIALLTDFTIFSTFMLRNNKAALDIYAEAGSIAEEVLGSIRNAIAFGTQERLAAKYASYLSRAGYYDFRTKLHMGFLLAVLMFIFFSSYALAFWQGSKFILAGDTAINKVITVLMSVMIGAFQLGNVAPHLQALATAISAAAKLFNTIDRQSPIDASREDGITLENLSGNIRLENVSHIYPSRPEVRVMSNISLSIPAGKVTALVGASGSGKSTIIGLLERFYNPVGGTIYLDGVDITTLNLKWLRQQMALVSQEPTLFSTSIFNNIAHGLIGPAKTANAHDFISSLPDGYETNVGERGFLLSGGQKQRIAIARAVVSDPKILLLDEATSALDTKSEGVVQAALEKAAAGRTTITIAHRLSTIKEAHNIIVMANGEIVEQGNHDALIESKGAYFNLVSAQNIAAAEELTAEEEAQIDEEEIELMRKRWTFTGFNTAEDDIQARLNRYSTVYDATLQIEAETQPEPKRAGLWTLFKLVASFNRPEWKFAALGLFVAILSGGGQPVSSVFFSKQITTLSQPVFLVPKHKIQHDSNFWSAMFFMLGMSQLITLSIQGYILARCSERLVYRVRDRVFRTMLRQDVAFFDSDENTSGSLTAFLSMESIHVAGMSGTTLGTVLLSLTTLVVACIIALAIGWKLSLVCISTIPVLLGCGFFRVSLLVHFQRRSKAAYASSASYASEAISAIRTVASLTSEGSILSRYERSLAEQRQRSLISVAKTSALYAASQSCMFLCMAVGFWYGGTLIGKHEYGMFQFFLCFTSIIFSTQSAGSIFSFAPDMSKSHTAAQQVKNLFDRKPTIDTWAEEGEPVTTIEGTIEFRNVHFRYPTRPEQPVLRGVNLTVRPGQYVALVGASGCGKSTSIALMERFYDPISGGVYVDGREISRLNINDYRSFISLVSQEPTLYQGSIKENILLGTSREDVSDEELEHACREANIYDFIVSLPDGFNTTVGAKGTMLSGGQKQRVAIARALIRDPKILLLDEATSALDSESEKVVQAALDRAAKGRTTIAVAHRLSTIQNADVIYVFDQGRIVEQGTHSELMWKNGRYAELVNLQSLAKNT
ncbi:hypothetical protein NLG97_g2010 [Lecanicillium saksenae]|uniref:Uncharacterized protein n=1 Tax=Lecanicillium saksenae TaxID=468837 RepID=A0ACC1R3I4_9HYPO|nr:hypothetical protein NLG97_g2010 [Lecanicillium saksenae]